MRSPFNALCVLFMVAAVSCRQGQAVELPFVFRDVAQDVGLHQPLRGMMGHAAAWGDVDGDGWIDLFVGTFADRPVQRYRDGGADGPVPNQLLLNRKGQRFVVTSPDVFDHLGRASGSVFADFDNDGLVDLYVANNGRLGKENLLYHNLGGGLFENITDQAGAALQLPDAARSAVVLDYDGDGLLDLLVLGSVRKSASTLFRNLGGMKFERSTALPNDVHGLGAAVGDITGNGWPDVMIGGPNRLFVNLSGNFREATELGIETAFTREDDSASCGIAFGDFDRDGRADMLIGSHHKAPWKNAPNAIRLYRNLGSTPQQVHFEEVTQLVGIVKYPMKVPHVELRDFNNDGWPDLYTAVVVFRDGNTYPTIFKNLGATDQTMPTFQESAFVHRQDFPDQSDAPNARSNVFYEKLVAKGKVMYFAPGPSGDFDNDGRLDLFLPSWWPTLPSLLLKNETQSGNYLDVSVTGNGGINRMGIGSVVRAYAAGHASEREHLLASEEIATGYGFCSGQPAIAHLGLDKASTCDVVVTLPHGKGQIVRRSAPVNRQLRIEATGSSD